MLKSRIVNKHDVESNWLLATNFTPMKGELIIYDPDETHPMARCKIGDGKTNINNLSFIVNPVLPDKEAVGKSSLTINDISPEEHFVDVQITSVNYLEGAFPSGTTEGNTELIVQSDGSYILQTNDGGNYSYGINFKQGLTLSAGTYTLKDNAKPFNIGAAFNKGRTYLENVVSGNIIAAIDFNADENTSVTFTLEQNTDVYFGIYLFEAADISGGYYLYPELYKQLDFSISEFGVMDMEGHRTMYPINEDGSVTGVKSLYPTMYMDAAVYPEPFVRIKAKYYGDTSKILEEKLDKTEAYEAFANKNDVNEALNSKADAIEETIVGAPITLNGLPSEPQNMTMQLKPKNFWQPITESKNEITVSAGDDGSQTITVHSPEGWAILSTYFEKIIVLQPGTYVLQDGCDSMNGPDQSRTYVKDLQTGVELAGIGYRDSATATTTFTIDTPKEVYIGFYVSEATVSRTLYPSITKKDINFSSIVVFVHNNDYNNYQSQQYIPTSDGVVVFQTYPLVTAISIESQDVVGEITYIKDLPTYIQEQISTIVGGAPEALDTLNELAAALNNDESFATTVMSEISAIGNAVIERVPYGEFLGVTNSLSSRISSLETQVGNIDTALDNILALQADLGVE